MKPILIALFFLLPIGFDLAAQQNQPSCMADVPSQKWEAEFQKLILTFKENQQQKSTSPATYTIPVIFHVIHAGEAVGTYPNIDSGQIYSQFSVLNADLNGQGKNVNTYPATAFTNWVTNQGLPAANIDNQGRLKIGNLDIQFCAAAKDSLGNTLAEAGIDRIDHSSKGLANPTSFTDQNAFRNYLLGSLAPASIWDPKKYLNVWVTDKNSALNVGGFSRPPALSGLPDMSNVQTADSNDGIWLWAKVTGSRDLYPSGEFVSMGVSGRTMTHEVGHWLGLRHIWGDANCGNDYCDDTPAAQTSNGGNPTYPLNAGSCAGNSPDGELFMNFMDYTSDPFKYMFSEDQLVRMKTCLQNAPNRNQLGTNGLCPNLVVAVAESPDSEPKIYPNPSSGVFNIKNIGEFRELEILDLAGKVVFRKSLESQDLIQLSLPVLTEGIYFLRLKGIDRRDHFVKILVQL